MNEEKPIDKNIFRQYDIRGVYDSQLNNRVVTTLGRAIAKLLKDNKIDEVIIGRDCRVSSDALFQYLSHGLIQSGIDVFDAGMIPTPTLYFAVNHYKMKAGVMITGSHNPPHYNGFKIQIGDSTIYGEQIQKLYQICIDGRFIEGKGKMSPIDALNPYIDYMVKNIKIEKRGIKFAVDCGNGTVGVVLGKIMKAIGLKPLELFCEPDGNFPNHHPDPTVAEFLAELIKTVKVENCQLGLAYDGDGDRLGVVDSDGQILWGDRLLIIFSREILKRHPGAAILGEVKCSQLLYDDVIKNGGRPIMWKTGHSLIKAKMKEENALVGGEMSGHLFFRDRYLGFDDAIYASLRLLELVSKSEGGLKTLTSNIPATVVTPEIRTDCPDEKKFKVVEKIKEVFGKRTDVKIIDIDGARIQFEGGWGLVRASNTQPVIVTRFEADTRENLEKIKSEIEGHLRTVMRDV